jgi:hypothetical protein
MIAKKTAIKKVKMSLKTKAKDTIIQNNMSEEKTIENSKSQFSRIKIEEYLASITKK